MRTCFLVGLAVFMLCGPAAAQDMPGALLEVQFEAAPRAQIAIWLETANGTFLRTLALTEAVAYRGIGNRPGASQMNSGYRWPYGRREGALPIWASRRAAAPGAKQWKRVIFQSRASEGRASQTNRDQSVDNYFCLSFNNATTRRDALDAVSCASIFNSDKGRYLTTADVQAGYGEPWQDAPSGAGSTVPLQLTSLYPPRMDAAPCSPGCYDHADLADFAAHARNVMPEIDAVSIATLPGNTAQSLLFSLPPSWPRGAYTLLVEINVEGDYNQTFNDLTYPTPMQPGDAWDSWAMTFGYPYRGQPSIAFALPFTLEAIGELTVTATAPIGRSSWNFWSVNYGVLEAMTGMTDDPAAAPGSGADRLRAASDGTRLTLTVDTLGELPEPDPQAPPKEPVPAGEDAPADSETTEDPSSGPPKGMQGEDPDDPQQDPTQPSSMEPPAEGEGVILVTPGGEIDGPVGAIRDLALRRHEDRLHAHEWISMRLRAAEAAEPLHRYEVRVSTQAIVDDATFVRHGRPAKTASEDVEGAVSLMLPVTTPAGDFIESDIGNLTASTHYYVAVRARDRFNREGPISVAQIRTSTRVFATVTPCVVATAAFGSPLAREIAPLRRLRDRHLQNHAWGRALVAAYYEHGPPLARAIEQRPWLRAVARTVIEPVAALARRLQADQ